MLAVSLAKQAANPQYPGSAATALFSEIGGMRGFLGCVGGWLRLPALTRLVLAMDRMSDVRWRRDVVGLDHGPHWLYRDIEPSSGRVTRQAMRRPPDWPNPSG